MRRSTALMIFIVFPILMVVILGYMMFAPSKKNVKTGFDYAPTITMTEIADVENPVVEENDEYHISCKDGTILKTDKFDTTIQYMERMPSIYPYVLTDTDGDYTHYTVYLFKD